MDDLYEPIALILINYGVMTRLNPIRVASIYKDHKIRITGLIDSDSPRHFVRFIVHLKMSTGEPDQERVITASLLSDLPVTSSKTDTLVYSAEVAYGDFSGYTLVEFTRPGRWINYIKQLHEKIQKQAAYEKSVNNTPLDDSALFPDVADVTES
ncbi:MAG: hypothetical protein Q9P44_06560 [Anaerolineae bacterium]|nr:hypothetical protein [Anaerolineae bacterium]